MHDKLDDNSNYDPFSGNLWDSAFLKEMKKAYLRGDLKKYPAITAAIKQVIMVEKVGEWESAD